MARQQDNRPKLWKKQKEEAKKKGFDNVEDALRAKYESQMEALKVIVGDNFIVDSVEVTHETSLQLDKNGRVFLPEDVDEKKEENVRIRFIARKKGKVSEEKTS